MNQTKTELISDPLFQLNAVLWLAQPLPEQAEITPLLYNNGFQVLAIGLQLTLPPSILLKVAKTNLAINDSAHPDVIISREQDGKFAFIECKKNSFGADSSTAAQARTLLIAADGPAAEILALQPSQVSRVVLEYLMPEEKRAAQAETNKILAVELKESGLLSGEAQFLGLRMTSKSLDLVVGDNNDPFGLGIGSHQFMTLEPDTDPRPIYFIPYDPLIEQSPTEREMSKRILFERIHASVVSNVGRSTCPIELILQTDNLLHDATFRMYARWDDHDSKVNLKRLLKQFMDALAKTLNDEIPEVIHSPQLGQWTLSLPSEPRKEKTLDVLTAFSCETLSRAKEPEPDLFEKLN